MTVSDILPVLIILAASVYVVLRFTGLLGRRRAGGCCCDGPKGAACAGCLTGEPVEKTPE